MRAINKKQLQHACLIAAALLLPALFALYLASTSGLITVRDHWKMLDQIYSVDGFSTNLSDWFRPHYDHIIFIPKLIFALNMFVTGGANNTLSIISWLLALIQAGLLVWLIPPQIKDFKVKLVTILAISAFCFAPTAADNWAHGFSGVLWLLANILSIIAIGFTWRFFKGNSYGWLGGSLLFASLSMITYGTAIGVWLALIAAFFIVRKKVWWGLLIGCCTIMILAFAVATRPTLGLTSMSLFDRAIVFGPYLAIFFGGAFTTNIPLAFAIGFTGLVIATIMLIHFGMRASAVTRINTLPWLLLIIYSLTNAVIISQARLDIGLGYATTQRYVNISGLFWIAILVILAYWFYNAKLGYTWATLAPYAILVLVMWLAMYPLGFDRARRWQHQFTLQPIAVMALEMDILDRPAIENGITYSFYSFVNQLPALKANGMVPFQKSSNDGCGQPGDTLSQPVSTGSVKIESEFEFIDRVNETGFRTVGWLETEPGLVDCIIFVDENGTIQGKALAGFNRPDLNNPDRTGWFGYTYITSPEQQLTAYVRLKENAHWIQLNPTRSLQNPGQPKIEIYQTLIGDPFDEYTGLEQFNAILQKLGYTPPPNDLIYEVEK